MLFIRIFLPGNWNGVNGDLEFYSGNIIKLRQHSNVALDITEQGLWDHYALLDTTVEGPLLCVTGHATAIVQFGAKIGRDRKG
jgi:hypothetical protein